MTEMMEEELTAMVGPKHAKIPDRVATRHASAPGSEGLEEMFTVRRLGMGDRLACHVVSVTPARENERVA